jgi:hypothetical protein
MRPDFKPRARWRLDRIVHHELTPDYPLPVRLTFYQRAANNRWRRYRAQQLVSPPQIAPDLARQRRQARDRQRRHRARVAAAAAAKARYQFAIAP